MIGPAQSIPQAELNRNTLAFVLVSGPAFVIPVISTQHPDTLNVVPHAVLNVIIFDTFKS